MLIFRKQTRKQKDPFSIFPSLNTSIFYDVSKNSEHINTFRGARLKSHPSKIPKLNFLEQEESQRPKWTSFHTFFHNGELKSFTQKSQRKDNLINLIQTF